MNHSAVIGVATRAGNPTVLGTAIARQEEIKQKISHLAILLMETNDRVFGSMPTQDGGIAPIHGPSSVADSNVLSIQFDEIEKTISFLEREINRMCNQI